MSEEKKQENVFKFGLTLKGEKLYERIFSADLYNPVVRYSVDIRERIPSIINEIQQVLQKQSTNLNFDSILNSTRNSSDYVANTKKYYKHICKINRMSPVKLFVPTFFNKETQKVMVPVKGTEFKFGVYINQNPIVERNFYVENYNPEARFSNELTVVLNDIVDYLKNYLKKSDVNHMWNDYDLITTYELNIQQVRELSKDRREEFLKRKSDLGFVEKVRLDFNKNSEYAI
jgi:hypothetical protein